RYRARHAVRVLAVRDAGVRDRLSPLSLVICPGGVACALRSGILRSSLCRRMPRGIWGGVMGRRVGWERAVLRRGMVGLAVVVVGGALVVAGATGGYSAQRPRLLSGAAWLASTQVGQLTLLDGASAETAAQVRVAPPGDQLDVVQQGSSAYAVNRSAGVIRRVDGATFEVTPPVSPLPGARAGLRAFAGPNAVYAV